MLWLFLLGLSPFLSSAWAETRIDPHGYVIFCPCMGRFGNQMDQYIGAFNFARALDRTLVLAPFIEFPPGTTVAKMIDFELIFQLKPLERFHRVITAKSFMSEVAPKIWPKSKRKAFCWNPRHSSFDNSAPTGCQAKEGNPFGPFWDYLKVDFIGDEYYGTIPGGHQLYVANARSHWDEKFPSKSYPVLSFTGAPASFPSKKEHWTIQHYFKWSTRVSSKARQFVAEFLPRPYVALHLRNGRDWESACKHVPDSAADRKNLFSSAVCLGEHLENGPLTSQLCLPTFDVVVNATIQAVASVGARSVFVTSDRDHMVEELESALSAYDISVRKLKTEDPYVALALLADADHLVANCVSTFSAIAVRMRMFYSSTHQRPTSFFGFQPSKPVREEL